MNVLVTGAKGFIGRNLCESLKNIRDRKDLSRPDLMVENVFEYDVDSGEELLSEYARSADFVFHLAGVNRPDDEAKFESGNPGFTEKLQNVLKNAGNTCPVMLSSSVQATLSGRFGVTKYGLSKKKSEELVFQYGEETGAEVFVYRFPNVAGKWSKPNYNSAIVTFCYNVSRDIPINISDRETVLDILFVEDLVKELIDGALSGRPHRCDFDGTDFVFSEEGKYCGCPVYYKEKLGQIADLILSFRSFNTGLMLPVTGENSFAGKLLSVYLSYLPKEAMTVKPPVKSDSRGSFTELMKMKGIGQISVNVTAPGETKGLHWHHSKWEIFTVVAGKGLIRERRIGSSEIIEFTVSGDEPTEVLMLPGFTHSITNLSNKENLVTLMYANEIFDPERPDTFREEV